MTDAERRALRALQLQAYRERFVQDPGAFLTLEGHELCDQARGANATGQRCQALSDAFAQPAIEIPFTITDAARVGAREGAVHRTTACSSATTKINSMGVIPPSGTIGCTTSGPNTGDQVTVTVTSTFSVGLPGYFGVPALNQTFTIQGVAKERME